MNLLNLIFLSLPLTFLSFGALFTEKIGNLDVEIEGIAYFSAFLTAFMLYLGLNVYLAICLSLISSLLLSSITVFFLSRGNHIFLLGLAINFLSYFLTHFMLKFFFSQKASFHFSLYNNNFLYLFLFLYFILYLFCIYVFYFSTLRFAFEVIKSRKEMQIIGLTRAFKIKLFCIYFSTSLASLSGSFLTLFLGFYSYNLGLNNGWLSLAILYISFANPILIPFISIFWNLLQDSLFNSQEYINSSLSHSLPYFLAILINLIILTIKRRKS